MDVRKRPPHISTVKLSNTSTRWRGEKKQERERERKEMLWNAYK